MLQLISLKTSITPNQNESLAIIDSLNSQNIQILSSNIFVKFGRVQFVYIRIYTRTAH